MSTETTEATATLHQNSLASLTSLSVGDFMPPFQALDHGGTSREIQLFAGKPTILTILPRGADGFVTEFAGLYKKNLGDFQKHNSRIIYMAPVSAEEVAPFREKCQIPEGVLCDEKLALSRAFGIEDQLETQAHSYLLNSNQRIVGYYHASTPEAHIEELLQASRDIKNSSLQLPAFAPILAVPEALSAAQCQRVIDYWEAGQKYKGTIGEADSKVLSSGKRRVDVDGRDRDFLQEMDIILSKRLYPEIRKVFNLDVTYRDRYKIGCYKSEDQGFYNQHRDTGVASLAHRRVSFSLILNDGFEGGFLEFPEYGPEARFTAKAGTALCFPSPLLHQVATVTAGERFIMVSFLHGDLEEQGRKAYMEQLGQAYNPGDVSLFCQKTYPDLQYSPNFYTRS